MSGDTEVGKAGLTRATDEALPPTGLVELDDAEVSPLREAMGDLQRSVAEYYAETARAGDLGRPVRRFLADAQVLNDLLTNEIGDASTYRSYLDSAQQSGAELVNAVKFARNVVQHVLHIVKPSDEMRLIGGALGMRVYAEWDEIPLEVVARLRKGTKTLEPLYKSRLQGEEVTGTMLSLLRFFAAIAPRIIHRDHRGEWTGFPLLSQPGVNTPLHPEEPLDIDQSLRWMNSRVPGGDCRVLLGQYTFEGKPFVYGQAFVGRLSYAPFVETVAQANFDIQLGYPYLIGDLAANHEDVTERIPGALQGVVLESRGDVLDWATQLPVIESRDDWNARGVDTESWNKTVRLEANESLPAGFLFSPRRARRLNALVPPK